MRIESKSVENRAELSVIWKVELCVLLRVTVLLCRHCRCVYHCEYQSLTIVQQSCHRDCQCGLRSMHRLPSVFTIDG